MSYEFYGLPSYVFANKLKTLKAGLKKWNEEVFGDAGKKKNELLEGIRELNLVEECRCLEEEEMLRKIDMSRELEKTLIFKEMNWRQITSFMVEEGDKNTIFSQGGQLTL
jgi:hypothetical protein